MQRLLLLFRWVVTLSVTAVIGFLGGAGGMSLFLSIQNKPDKPIEKKEVLQQSTEAPVATITPIQVSADLAKVIEIELTGTKGKYSIVIENLRTGERYVRDEDRIFETASLYKLWVMAAIFDEIESHRVNKSDLLRQDVSVLNQKFRIASESAERTEGTVSMTVENALEQMITVSDNYAALLLTEKIRLSRVSAFLKEHNFSKSKVGTGGKNPLSTPSDIALFYKKLLNGELANTENTSLMLSLLERQKLNKKIPKYLPAGTKVKHKTGELGAFSHDAGIVSSPKGDYLIVILSESSNRIQADERIANVSRAVFQYFRDK